MQEISNRETFGVKMQLHELEKDLDRERQKNKGGLVLEALKKRAEEDRIKAEEEREKDEIKRREADRVRHIRGGESEAEGK